MRVCSAVDASDCGVEIIAVIRWMRVVGVLDTVVIRAESTGPHHSGWWWGSSIIESWVCNLT